MEQMILLVGMTLIGLFAIFCAIMNYDWFIESRKAHVFVKLFGRTGARVFYVILGIALIVFAVLAYMRA